MRVATLNTSNAILQQIDQLSTQQSNLENQVSTGQRISNPSDDPAGVEQALDLQNTLGQTQQYAKNATQALTVAQASASGLQSLNSVSNSAGELATLGTGTLGPTALTAYAAQANQLIQQAVQAANTQFNGEYLYGGTATSTPPFTVATDASGNITGVTYAGNLSQASVPLSTSTSVPPTTDGATNTGIATFINNLVALRNALTSGDTTAVAATQQGLSDGENVITTAVATNGGMQTRIQAAQTTDTAQTTDLQSQISSIVSADLPTTIVRLDQTQTAYQAALQTAVSSMQTSILNYIH
jgi:flagellar hook-associated protein 3 FlgL